MKDPVTLSHCFATSPWVSDAMRVFLQAHPALPTPALIMDIKKVGENYRTLTHNFAENFKSLSRKTPCDIYYALKANPAREILQCLKNEGAFFDAASFEEIELCLAQDIHPAKISWGNSIKKETQIKQAIQKGIGLFAFDSKEELQKIARATNAINAPQKIKVFCRIRHDESVRTAACPASNKFGCDATDAIRLLTCAQKCGLEPYGISYHVGSQQTCALSWAMVIKESARIMRALKQEGIKLKMLNLGGGFPVPYHAATPQTPTIEKCARTITHALNKYFDDDPPRIILEPGRCLVANAGIIKSEVILVTQRACNKKNKNKSKSKNNEHWIYVDVGRSSGLVESVNHRIMYPIVTHCDMNEPVVAARVAGPTCDWSDVLNEHEHYHLPVSLKAGDALTIAMSGAYTSSCSTIGFNGFHPLRCHYI